MSDKNQENSINTLDTANNEEVVAPTKNKVKRIMSEAQKQNLVRARQRALELRQEIRSRANKPTKKPTKLEERLSAIVPAPDTTTSPPVVVEPTAPETVSQAPMKKPQYKFVRRDGGLFLDLVS